ncbi:hypothetical protein ACLB2K_005899 [Fragaria x ananassa]
MDGHSHLLSRLAWTTSTAFSLLYAATITSLKLSTCFSATHMCSHFPLNTKSFNIVLNGWANIIGNPRNAERIWAEMTNRGVSHDAISYSCLISCHSKSSNLTKVLTIFRRMKKLNVEPDTKVYNALIYALGKAGHLNEAINLMKTMQEKGLVPTIVTYNSLIKTLCKAGEIDQAKHILHQMMEQRGLVPTIQTYHPFFRVVTTADRVFELLEKMKSTGCSPNTDTYIMLIRKFCQWRQLDNVFKLWGEMKPRTEEMLQAWFSGKQQTSKFQSTDGEVDPVDRTQPATNTKLEIHKKSPQEKDFRQQPESHISCKFHLARGKANDRGSVQGKKKEKRKLER